LSDDPRPLTPEMKPAEDYSTGIRLTSADDAAMPLRSRLEALLFVSAAPVDATHLSAALDVGVKEVERALEELRLEIQNRGVRLQRHRAGFQLTTAPQAAADVERLLDLETTARLTRAALEVLAIIAYEQPVTRPHIDSIRGVNSDSVLSTLLRYGLIEETGRSEGPGRPILYATTSEFLQHFGLGSLEQMPPLAPVQIPEEPARPEPELPSEEA
jgi:segregation and condensation protein B